MKHDKHDKRDKRDKHDKHDKRLSWHIKTITHRKTKLCPGTINETPEVTENLYH